MAESLYSVLYKLSITIKVGDKSVIVTSGDVVSIAIMSYYDDYVAPIIRLRLYSDLTLAEKITENPDDINVGIFLNGGIYNLDGESPKLVIPVDPIHISQKAYTENKNSPVSTMDNYQAGIRKSDDLNVQNKVPIELYLYDETVISAMNFNSSYVFKRMSIYSIVDTILTNQGIMNRKISPFINNDVYDQVLVPSMSLSETIAYFDHQYGLYKKGGQLFSEFNEIVISDSDVNNGSTPIPLYVESYKNNSTASGIKKAGGKYFMKTPAQSASVTTSSEIDKIINSKKLNVTDANSLETKKYVIDDLYDKDDNSESIQQIVHKTMNPYIGDVNKARMRERLTKIDISGTGFDVSKFRVDSRFNVIFESPIRGMSVNDVYRMTMCTHVLTNVSSELFEAQTSLSLCTN